MNLSGKLVEGLAIGWGAIIIYETLPSTLGFLVGVAIITLGLIIGDLE